MAEISSNKGVSCLCLTYGRPRLLEEAIQSFVRQETEWERELIVINDLPQQHLLLREPIKNVEIINLPMRIRTLGEKRNFAASVARYDHLLIWDDDDIHLPWRIQVTMDTLRHTHFFKSPWAWTMNDGVIEPKPTFNLFHSGCAYTRHLFETVGGYPIMNGGEDSAFEKRIKEHTGWWFNASISMEQYYYIYRWRHGQYHTTGVDNLAKIRPEVSQYIEHLSPFWQKDYVALARKTLLNHLCPP